MKAHFKNILFIALLVAGCSKVINISTINYKDAYQPDIDTITPFYQVTHVDGDRSRLKISISENNLLYLRDLSEDYYIANFTVGISVFDSFQKKRNIFSTELHFSDTLARPGFSWIEREITFPMTTGKKYYIFTKLLDKNRREEHMKLLFSDKTSSFSEGFFEVMQPGNNVQYPIPYSIPAHEKLKISHRQLNDFAMEVSRYPVPDYFPHAPYVTEPDADPPWPEADTSFMISFTEATADLILPDNGIYWLSDPGTPTQGFLITSFWNTFPEIPSDERMLFPLRYITSADEFNALLALDAPRLAAERFWTKTAGNPDRAQTVFNRYNERVVLANKLFSSHVPGWQTDRGMIYIVMGPPDMVYRSDNGETWYYNETLNNPSAEFRFVNVENIFSDHHLVLERNTASRRSWNLAVDRWRR